MKKFLKYLLAIWVAAFIMTPPCALSLDSLSSLRQPNGFRGIYWGASKLHHPYLFSISDNVDGIETFSKECENFTLGSAELYEVKYHFHNDQFYQVSLLLNSGSDQQPLLDMLSESYGTPEKESGVYVWGNDNIVIHLFPSGASLSYLPILNEISQKQNKD